MHTHDAMHIQAEDMRTKLEDLKTYAPILACVCNPGMRGRHWETLSGIMGSQVCWLRTWWGRLLKRK